nr:CLK4-associating serine/arginine rich protein-like [Camelus dromedarius]
MPAALLTPGRPVGHKEAVFAPTGRRAAEAFVEAAGASGHQWPRAASLVRRALELPWSSPPGPTEPGGPGARAQPLLEDGAARPHAAPGPGARVLEAEGRARGASGPARCGEGAECGRCRAPGPAWRRSRAPRAARSPTRRRATGGRAPGHRLLAQAAVLVGRANHTRWTMVQPLKTLWKKRCHAEKAPKIHHGDSSSDALCCSSTEQLWEWTPQGCFQYREYRFWRCRESFGCSQMVELRPRSHR